MTQGIIPAIDLQALTRGDRAALRELHYAATEIGFATVENTSISGERVREVIEIYRRFFHLPADQKAAVDMSKTGANRGLGLPCSEQVDPSANPDYKQYFDCGLNLPEGHPLSVMSVYAPNLWPANQPDFRRVIERYYIDSCATAMEVLRALSLALGRSRAAFDSAFETPMALLRGNFYPERPEWATDKDFGIATHTDYGCLTLLATDGAPGLDVRKRGGGWIPVQAAPGTFVINFGEMMQFWTAGEVRATPHRVVGGVRERISVPLFFNPSYTTNIAPPQSDQVISAGEHLERRFNETYLHLQKA